MDAYEATRIVFSRIQSLDPENAAKIMGLLLIQDHGDKEMIRLAFGPEALLHSLVLKARKDLGLIPATTPSTPSSTLSSSPFFSRQNSSSGSSGTPSSSPSPRLLGVNGLPLSLSMPSSSSSSWVSNSSPFLHNGMVDLQGAEELISPNSAYGAVNVGSSSSSSNSTSFFGGGGSDLMDDLQLQDHLSFLNDPTAVSASATGLSKMGPAGGGEGDLFYPPESPTSPSEAGMLFQYGTWAGTNGHHRRSCSVADVDLIGGGFGWKPCLYFARGYCKNGASCRFLHGPPESQADSGVGKPLDVVDHCQELLRSKSAHRLVSQLMPPSPTFPFPNASKCMNFLLQQQGVQSDSQRAAAAAAALMLGDDSHKFGGRSMMRMERSEFAAGATGIVNPGSRQIYLTFPADSTFREEDVSNYFSIYGPVQDVRIPYQQKRMFGFVTFVYPETVKLILAKGNPHFVCDARVLVKPYKEKGKVPDKYRKQQQQQGERGDFAACSPPATLDSRDRYDLQQLGARMLYNNSHEVMLRRKLEEQQADMQQAIELQGRRLMGLQLLDVTRRNLQSGASPLPSPSLDPFSHYDSNPQEGHEDACPTPGATLHSPPDQQQNLQKFHKDPFMQVSDHKESSGNDRAVEERLQQESNYPENNNVEHNLPDSPFASPTKSLTDPPPPSLFTSEAAERSSTTASSPPAVNNITCGNASSTSIPIASSFFSGTSSLDNMASYKSCFLQMPRFSSGHGAIGM